MVFRIFQFGTLDPKLWAVPRSLGPVFAPFGPPHVAGGGLPALAAEGGGAAPHGAGGGRAAGAGHRRGRGRGVGWTSQGPPRKGFPVLIGAARGL